MIRNPVNKQFVSDTAIGLRVSRWTVIAPTDRKAKNGESYWLCRCDCGTEREVTLANIKCQTKRRREAGCGCVKKEWIAARTLPDKQALKNRYLQAYRQSASRRELEWSLVDSLFFEIIKKNCHYCGVAPSTELKRNNQQLTVNGVDRRNNGIGYTLENVVPCCKTCNYLKKSMPYGEFVAYLDRVTVFRTNKLTLAKGA